MSQMSHVTKSRFCVFGIAINFIILLFFICKSTHYSLFFRIFAAIFRIVYDERQNYIGIVEHIHDAHVKYIAS